MVVHRDDLDVLQRDSSSLASFGRNPDRGPEIGLALDHMGIRDRIALFIDDDA